MGSGRREQVVPGIFKVYVNIPLDKLEILMNDNCRVLREIESRTQTKISVDSINGYAVIEPASSGTPVTNVIKAQEILKAISIGFPLDRVWRLLSEDQVLIIINLKEVVGNSSNHLTRVKGRIIGEGGKVKRNIEEMTGTYVSVHDDYIGIIGDYEYANVAREAIEMLIQGRQHSTVYRYLDRAVHELKRRRSVDLWIK